MNHPYEQLADVVDGTLDEESLAGVRAHLDTCAECREDVALATRGGTAARALPHVPAPSDLHDRVVAAAGGGGGRGRGTPLWYRWAGAAAAAAAVIVLAIALPNVGDDERGRGAPEAALSTGAEDASANNTAGSDPDARRENKDYSQEDLQDLAAGTAAAFGSEANQPAEGPRTLATPGPLQCVIDAWQNQPSGDLVDLIQARFQGEAAYFAVYLEGPRTGEPPDTASVYVASRSDCRPLSVAAARISR
jgi:anti-sigma factor RsiW